MFDHFMLNQHTKLCKHIAIWRKKRVFDFCENKRKFLQFQERTPSQKQNNKTDDELKNTTELLPKF